MSHGNAAPPCVITSVQVMARGKGKNGDEAAKRKALKEAADLSNAVRENDEEGDSLRKRRNDAIVKAAKYAPALEIAQACDIKQSYVSRVIRAKGKPESGSKLDRQRDGANA